MDGFTKKQRVIWGLRHHRSTFCWQCVWVDIFICKIRNGNLVWLKPAWPPFRANSLPFDLTVSRYVQKWKPDRATALNVQLPIKQSVNLRTMCCVTHVLLLCDYVPYGPVMLFRFIWIISWTLIITEAGLCFLPTVCFSNQWLMVNALCQRCVLYMGVSLFAWRHIDRPLFPSLDWIDFIKGIA